LILVPRFRRATLHAEDMLVGPFRLMRRLVTWFSIDLVIAGAAVALATLFYRLAGPLDVGTPRVALAALSIAVVFTIMNALTGVQKVHWRYASAGEAVDVLFSVLIATLLLILANTFIPAPRLPTGLLLTAGLFALAGFLAVRYRRSLWRGMQASLRRLRSVSAEARERVLVVGAGEAGQLTLWLLQNSPAARAFHVVGVIDDDLDKLGTLVHRVPVLGRCDRIAEIVKQGEIGMIVFAIHSIDPERRNQILLDCWRTHARTVVAPDILTFMRKGTDPSDRRTWFPQERRGIPVDLSPEEIGKDDLQEAIHDLAEMARLGDYAALTAHLQQLDDQLKGELREEAAYSLVEGESSA
jgi:FlaA1/EpsC-like NDP-sugar epimerase